MHTWFLKFMRSKKILEINAADPILYTFYRNKLNEVPVFL